MNTSSLLLTGIGLRTPHYQVILDERPKVAWLEVHSENYFAEGGKPLYFLKKIRENYPISLHGVSLSLGSADELNWQHLKKLRDLILQVEPCLISDHLCWCSINGRYLHDLLPIPYTEEALTHLINRINQVQDYLQQEILIENISSYVEILNADYTEWDFLRILSEKTGCGILLDISNLYLSSLNIEFNINDYLNGIPAKAIKEIHLGGFAAVPLQQKTVYIDSHDQAISPKVWDWFKIAIQKYGIKPTIIEWDNDIPSFQTLFHEANLAEKILRECYATTKLAS